MPKPQKIDDAGPETPAWIEVVKQQVGSVKFGVVQILVHDSRVVQIERTEKVRIEPKKSDGFYANQKTGGGYQNH